MLAELGDLILASSILADSEEPMNFSGKAKNFVADQPDVQVWRQKPAKFPPR